MYRINYTLFTLREKLRLRGGCYRSRASDKHSHDEIKSDWATATVHGFNMHDLLEDFVKGDVTDRDRKIAEEAMKGWVTYRKQVRVIPGLSSIYPDGNDEEETCVSNTPKCITTMVELMIKEIGESSKEVEVNQRDPQSLTKDADTTPREHTVADLINPMKTVTMVEDKNILVTGGAATPRRSNMKGSRHVDAGCTTPKQVRIDNNVTISSNHHALVPHPLPVRRGQVVPIEVETAKHSSNAFSETGVPQRQFFRRSSHYTPRRWASSVGLEKLDTSWSCLTWDSYDSMMIDEEQEWNAKWKEAGRAKQIVKEILRAWIRRRNGQWG